MWHVHCLQRHYIFLYKRGNRCGWAELFISQSSTWWWTTKRKKYIYPKNVCTSQEICEYEGRRKQRADEKRIRWLNALHLSHCSNKHQGFENRNKRDLYRPPWWQECIRITEWSSNTKHEMKKKQKKNGHKKKDKCLKPSWSSCSDFVFKKISVIVFLSFVSDNQNQAGTHAL